MYVQCIPSKHLPQKDFMLLQPKLKSVKNIDHFTVHFFNATDPFNSELFTIDYRSADRFYEKKLLVILSLVEYLVAHLRSVINLGWAYFFR